MLKDELEPIHTARGEEYLERVVAMLKEKVNFVSEILPLGAYFFDKPTTYDEKVRRKKWNDDVALHIQTYVDELVSGSKAKGEEMEAHLTAYAEANGVSKGSLMQPLRWAISGQAGGPPIFEMMELIGLDTLAERVGQVPAGE